MSAFGKLVMLIKLQLYVKQIKQYFL